MQSYDRRSKAVQGAKEEIYWSSVTVDMMSDEEKDGEKRIRHRPSYKSALFNRFIDKLDSHAVDKNRARFPRDIGSPRIKPIPPTTHKWMLNDSSIEQEDDQKSPNPELFSDPSSDNDSDNQC